MKRRTFSGNFTAAMAALLLSPLLLTAGTVISVTGEEGLATGINSTRAYATSWSQSNAYSGVAISIWVSALASPATPSGIAYLTTSIGPGTTTANEIAQTTFTLPVAQNACGCEYVTVFSGLNLVPGTYYLSVGADPNSNSALTWIPVIGTPAILTDMGVTQGASVSTYPVNQIVAPFPPASVFGTTLVTPLSYTVTGTLVPEPFTAPLVALGVISLAVLKRCRQLP